MSDAADRVAGVISDLRSGKKITRDQIREIGRIGRTFGVKRGYSEPYSLYLSKLHIKITKGDKR